jgi:hypothetical protein
VPGSLAARRHNAAFHCAHHRKASIERLFGMELFDEADKRCKAICALRNRALNKHWVEAHSAKRSRAFLQCSIEQAPIEARGSPRKTLTPLPCSVAKAPAKAL